MIFADKLILLRKKSGLSQEELAEKMEVSRQSVTKWECAQSVPELSKMVKLSNLFGVSLDYLVKDEIETEEFTDGEEERSVKKVTMEAAHGFLEIRKNSALKIAVATFLCIISPICLLIMGALSEEPAYNISESVAAGVGLCVMLLFVAVGIALFITEGNKCSEYAYLEREIFETEYGVTGMVKDRKAKFKGTYDTCNTVGIILCVLSVLPMFLGIMLFSENDILMVGAVCLLLFTCGIGVILFVKVGVVWSSFEKLLQEGEYGREKKESAPLKSRISLIYWLVATAVFLVWSFATQDWGYTWMVWVVAGVLYPVASLICNSVADKKNGVKEVKEREDRANNLKPILIAVVSVVAIIALALVAILK